MTIGMWIILIITGLLGFGLAAFMVYICDTSKGKIIAVVIISVLTCAALATCVWWFNSTESGKRWKKDFDSNTKGGINRTIEVYDMQGDKINTYKGKFDISENTDCGGGVEIKFDDQNGDRHIIYCTTGTVIVTENGE